MEKRKGGKGESANAPSWMELTASSDLRLSTEDFIHRPSGGNVGKARADQSQ